MTLNDLKLSERMNGIKFQKAQFIVESFLTCLKHCFVATKN